MNKEINQLEVIKYYHKLSMDYIPNEILENKYICYYDHECPNMFLWNTFFQFDNDIEFNHINLKKISEFFHKKGTKGYILSMSELYKEFSFYHGCYMYLNNIRAQNDINISKEFQLVKIEDTYLFTDYINNIFKMSPTEINKLAKLLKELNKFFNTNSYFFNYNDKTIGAITSIEFEKDKIFLFNLGILDTFQNKGYSRILLSLLLNKNKNKEIYLQTNVNNTLSKFTLPKLGFKIVGTHHLLELEKLLDKFEYNHE
ncbi:GNAT family N-acetyltransferase [Silvanigrella paludirubra]|uniref:GNAT family N-acetyltransferase n=1 Tax=Silvanigrella paludirubra TaxID=2499159 RepID=A0A6N6VQM3_9BACT|nr:GNAT family N-acetyltransferase [Silvanigrella paludirubra]KAB8037889.1 GNAT family N-acetyltransferase [Silvanigrella paludirubra]